jgi:acyl carrier protein
MDNLNDSRRPTKGDLVTEESVFLELKGFLTEILGEDVVEIVGVDRNSGFLKDLDMDSIQITVFAEKVNVRYGDRVDFMAWLSGKSLRKLLHLTVGQVSAFIAERR